MIAVVVNGVVKFLLKNDAEITAHNGGICITQSGEPDLIVGDIALGGVLEVTDVDANDLPDFTGDKYQYENGNFSLIEEV